MNFNDYKKKYFGVAIPVLSLRSQKSIGCGEFLDLPLLGNWAKKINLDLIQILPVNDTGTESSPYSSLSAFALHPIYIRLQEVEGAKNFEKEIIDFQKEANQRERVDFEKTYHFKLLILKQIYLQNYFNNDVDADIPKNSPLLDVEIQMNESTWLKIYSFYKTLKDKNEQKSWQEWFLRENIENPQNEDELNDYYIRNKKEILFYTWVQIELEKQFVEAGKELAKSNISLKGDIPIMMNEDSADVWYHRKYFNLKLRAGAPPDMFSPLGQNWGFPVYNWNALKQDNYQWWKQRIDQASKFYNAFRIDHVLGFFRIWQIPSDSIHGTLGYFSNSEYISLKELNDLGFGNEAVNWFSHAFVTFDEIKHFFEENQLNELSLTQEKFIENYFEQVKEEALYKLKEKYLSEKEIFESTEDELIKEYLLKLNKNVILIKVPKVIFSEINDIQPPDGGLNIINFTKDIYYTNSWYYYNNRAFHSLNQEEKDKLSHLIHSKLNQSEKLWEEKGLELLKILKEASSMLVCAEDLGVVPNCVPIVLEQLNILGLKIERWQRRYDQESQPFIDPKTYHYNTVCTPSVHDTSTLRGWLENEDWNKNEYLSLLDGIHLDIEQDKISTIYTPELAEKIIRRNVTSASKISMFQFQDLFAVSEQNIEINRKTDRINIPGTISSKNWTYKMPLFLEDLLEMKENELLKKLFVV